MEIKVFRYPLRKEWPSIIERPHIDASSLRSTVSSILSDVRHGGDHAVLRYEERFDHIRLEQLMVSDDEMRAASSKIDASLHAAIIQAHANIKLFHESQRFEGKEVTTMPGVTCWQKSVAIEKVGLYIPGGTAPLFSTVLMLATPAKIAGCRDIILCTPPAADGHVHPAILVAAQVAGVDKIFKAGGVQAIGAMAYGTESIPRVYKIFGPGNQYVMEAKQQVSIDGVAIDMPAGPSEVCVIADGQSNASFVAADLLSQAEHGRDSQVLLISTDEGLILRVMECLERQLEQLPRRDIAMESLTHSRIVLVADQEEAMALSNSYAPEHLILATADAMELAGKVVNAGSVFIGQYACESAGDYASGTNHTLPTSGYATAYSGVNLDSYCRKITFQHLSEEGILQIGATVSTMAHAEQLTAHERAMLLRMESLGMPIPQNCQ